MSKVTQDILMRAGVSVGQTEGRWLDEAVTQELRNHDRQKYERVKAVAERLAEECGGDKKILGACRLMLGAMQVA